MMFIIPKVIIPKMGLLVYYGCQGGQLKLDLGIDGTNPSIKDVRGLKERDDD